MPNDPKLPYAATKPAMPAQPQTLAQPAMTDRAMLEDLYRISKGAAIDTRNIRSDLDLLIGDVSSLKVDVRELQRWKISAEERATENSTRAKLPSTHDLETKKALADEIAAREALAVEVAAIKTETQAQSAALVGIAADASKAVTGFVHQHPVLFRSLATIATTIATSIAAWLAAKGH